MKPLSEHLSEVGENFDWEKVSKTMNFLNWTWHTHDEVPNIFAIIRKAEELMKEAYERKATISSGGFQAEYNKEFDTMRLSFIVAVCESYPD